MDPVASGTWRTIPGYDGSDSDEDEEEIQLKATAAERLEQIAQLLGERWVTTKNLDFTPAPKPKEIKDSNSYRTVAPRVWGPNGPLPAFRVEHTDAQIVWETFLSNGLVPAQDKDWIIQWSGPGMKDHAYQGLHEYQRVNHFPGSSELTRKDRMWRHLLEKAQIFGRGTFDFVPETFVLPDQLEQFLECYENSNHIWIVKPHASSRGRGIFLLRDTSELPLDECSVVSRYVDNPLLIQDLKWDLRVYVVVTGFEPLRAYVYREGLARFASSPYSTDEEHLQDAYRHLTNYSINKGAANFVENQELKNDHVGHKWSLSALLKHLKCVGVDTELMWARIHDLILKTLLAVEPTISAKTRDIACHHTNCFEVYGFDVLVDEDLKPWLIEVNLSPSMQAESPLDWQIKTALLADTFNLVGVCEVDQQMISTSRLRTRLMQARDAATPMSSLRRASSTGSLRPSSASGRTAKEPWRQRDRADTAADLLNAAAELAEPMLNGVVLDSLSERQLKMLGHSLQEIGRRHNFIRLYPTKETVRRYAPLTDRRQAPARSGAGYRLPSETGYDRGAASKTMSASQLLASLLFGPPPVRSAVPVARGRSNRSPVANGRRGPRSYYGATECDGASGSTAEGEDPSQSLPAQAPKAVKALTPKSGQRLLFMEYLVRVSSACESLSPSDKAKICQSPSYRRLLAFHRQLKQRQRAQQEQEDPEPGSDSEDELRKGSKDSSLADRGLIDDLTSLCRQTLNSLAKDSWEAEATLQDPSVPPKGLALGDDYIRMENLLPPAFARSLLGQKVLAGLQNLSAVDLERALSGQQCAAEFRLHLGAADDRDSEARSAPSFFHEGGEWKEAPRRRPASSGAGRRGQQGRQAHEHGPLHDLLRVPRDTVDPATMVEVGANSAVPRGLRRGKAIPGEEACARATPSSSPPPGCDSNEEELDDESPASAPPKRPCRAAAPAKQSSALMPPPRTANGGTAARPMSAYRRGGARPPSAPSGRPRPPAETTPAERAVGVLARSVATQSTRADPPLRIPVPARSATLPDLMAEVLVPLRHRPSNCVKMKTGSPAARSKNMVSGALQRSPPVHPVHVLHNFSNCMDIEL